MSAVTVDLLIKELSARVDELEEVKAELVKARAKVLEDN